MPGNRVPKGGAPGAKKKKKKGPGPDLAGRDDEETAPEVPATKLTRAEKGKAAAEGSKSSSKSRSGGRDDSALTRKKKHVVNFHFARVHLLCDDLYSSAGLLRQMTCSGMELPKVPDLAEADWYRMMASAITWVSFFYFCI